MVGVILDIYENGTLFEVEFVKQDGTNFEYENSVTFTVKKDFIIKRIRNGK